MKSIYEASTSLDAHMILNLLEQEGIQGRIEGEYLPGGVGELQAVNIVRVMVDESDYERAGRIISAWEAVEVENEEKSKHKTGSGFSSFLFGLIVGGGVIIWAYNSPITNDGIDYNGDGKFDEKWIFKDNRLDRTEVDRNFDGMVDVIFYMDRKGIAKKADFDDDFDGVFETKYRYKNGFTHSLESDLNKDGGIDYLASFNYGNLDEVVILGEGVDSRRKRQKFNMGKLIFAEIDSDGDGNYDTEYLYDYFEEVKKISDKKPISSQ